MIVLGGMSGAQVHIFEAHKEFNKSAVQGMQPFTGGAGSRMA